VAGRHAVSSVPDLKFWGAIGEGREAVRAGAPRAGRLDGHTAGQAPHRDRLCRLGAAGTGVFYANNIFIANRNGYQLADGDVAVIVVLGHEATTFAFIDTIWAKYGAVLGDLGKITDPRTKQPPTVNPLDSREFGPAMTNNGVTASSLAARGAHFAICDMATTRIAGIIARAVNSAQPEIYKELVANLLTNSHVVGAGAVAVNRAQERGYSMLTAG
jgi:hypothetical protein